MEKDNRLKMVFELDALEATSLFVMFSSIHPKVDLTTTGGKLFESAYFNYIKQFNKQFSKEIKEYCITEFDELDQLQFGDQNSDD